MSCVLLGIAGVIAGSVVYLNFARPKNDKPNDEIYTTKMAQLDMLGEFQAGSEAFPRSIDAQPK
jgi:hypothetical protein